MGSIYGGGDFYGFDPRDFAEDYSWIGELGSSVGKLAGMVPEIVELNRAIHTDEQQKFKTSEELKMSIDKWARNDEVQNRLLSRFTDDNGILTDEAVGILTKPRTHAIGDEVVGDMQTSFSRDPQKLDATQKEILARNVFDGVGVDAIEGEGNKDYHNRIVTKLSELSNNFGLFSEEGISGAVMQELATTDFAFPIAQDQVVATRNRDAINLLKADAEKANQTPTGLTLNVLNDSVAANSIPKDVIGTTIYASFQETARRNSVDATYAAMMGGLQDVLDPEKFKSVDGKPNIDHINAMWSNMPAMLATKYGNKFGLSQEESTKIAEQVTNSIGKMQTYGETITSIQKNMLELDSKKRQITIKEMQDTLSTIDTQIAEMTKLLEIPWEEMSKNPIGKSFFNFNKGKDGTQVPIPKSIDELVKGGMMKSTGDGTYDWTEKAINEFNNGKYSSDVIGTTLTAWKQLMLQRSMLSSNLTALLAGMINKTGGEINKAVDATDPLAASKGEVIAPDNTMVNLITGGVTPVEQERTLAERMVGDSSLIDKIANVSSTLSGPERLKEIKKLVAEYGKSTGVDVTQMVSDPVLLDRLDKMGRTSASGAAQKKQALDKQVVANAKNIVGRMPKDAQGAPVWDQAVFDDWITKYSPGTAKGSETYSRQIEAAKSLLPQWEGGRPGRVGVGVTEIPTAFGGMYSPEQEEKIYRSVGQ